ncbi:MAG: ABC transporter permease [Chelatococcus sp.]|uniref:ABC transporter permease n=1 Tax=unclassified Chelatococcus TaxID=2638111 RepID=UPI001BCE05AE|nr:MULTISPECIES: ABC transporter permease [unclassified Chelatococcus]CAH1648503.1 putative peptide transport system permease protein BAB2_1050 [Hyphomicrobiales bacterium]MBS7741926.1 ABC transporter permease [Chelatococcus sp. HY11]MBX3538804.1 ABC transporter permease [Chelatococcus sp.]MBX3541276.1 ABC transporter permease [Chelatococcus sp.]MCO5074831.1 ABC transporter permease [Chelatococcus sp.]
MLAYALRRIAQAVPILFLVSLISFGIMQLVPGDPAAMLAGPNATPAELAQLRQNLGLDRSFLVQLGIFYSNLLHGDLGHSLILGQPVLETVIERSPISISLAIYSLVLTILFGISIGMVAAMRHNRILDQIAMVIALLGVSVPNFWLGLVMIVLFSVQLGWLPTGGYIPFTEDPLGWLRSATMPAIAMALMQIGLLARLTRSTMLEILGQDYIRTARAKGLRETTIIVRHAMANVLMPIVTVIGMILSVLLSGSVIVETIFAVPGIGALLGNAILARDYPMIQGGLLFVASALLLLNIAVDLIYAWLDPRVRLQ